METMGQAVVPIGDPVLSADDIRHQLRLSRGQFEYVMKRYRDQLPQARRVGLVRLWKTSEFEAFRALCEQARRAGAIRNA